MESAAKSHSDAVGVQAMDDQHGILMDTFNALRHELAGGNGSAHPNRQVARLLEYIDMHFGCEESLLRRHGYPDLEKHRAAHQKLMGQILQVVNDAAACDDVEIHRMLGLVRGQYMEHLDGLDREYGQWLNARCVY